MIEIIAILTAGAFFFFGLGFFAGWKVGTKAREEIQDMTIDEIRFNIEALKADRASTSSSIQREMKGLKSE